MALATPLAGLFEYDGTNDKELILIYRRPAQNTNLGPNLMAGPCFMECFDQDALQMQRHRNSQCQSKTLTFDLVLVSFYRLTTIRGCAHTDVVSAFKSAPSLHQHRNSI